MNKRQLIKKISQNSGISQANTKAIIDALLKLISAEVAEDRSVQFLKFGRWYIKERLPRNFYNIATKQIERTHRKRIIAFSPSKEIRNIKKCDPNNPTQPGTCQEGSDGLDGSKKSNDEKYQTKNPTEHTSDKQSSREAVSIEVASTSSLFQNRNNKIDKRGNRNINTTVVSITSGNKIELYGPNLGQRVNVPQTIESGDLVYGKSTTYKYTDSDDTKNYQYPSVFIPFFDTPILEYRTNRVATEGVMESVFSGALAVLKDIEPQIEILRNISLPVRNRSYGYKPDIAIVWRERNVFIDVEIDEPYDLVSRKPIHYRGSHDCLRNDYFLNNGWSVIRIAEEQIVNNLSDMIEFVRLCIKVIAEDSRFFSEYKIDNTCCVEQWDYSLAEKWASEGYREKYLGITKIHLSNTTTKNKTIDEGYYVTNSSDNSEDLFDKPNDDIVEDIYTEIRNRITQVRCISEFVGFTKKSEPYDYIAKPRSIIFCKKLEWQGVSFYDEIEKKEVFLPFQDIDKCERKSSLYPRCNSIFKYVAKENDNWMALISEAILNSNPIEIEYESKHRGFTLEKRVVLFITPGYPCPDYIDDVDYFDEEYYISDEEKIRSANANKYADLASKPQVYYFDGFCTLRNSRRTFKISRIKGGKIYACRKNPHLMTGNDIWNVLEKGFGHMAARMYNTMTEYDQKGLINVGNYVNALVMHGNFEKAETILQSIPKSEKIPNCGKTWKETRLENFDHFIAENIEKENFERMKEILKEKGW